MPRTSRIWYPGAVLHVVARGNGGQSIFQDDNDRRRVLNRLEELKKRFRVLVYAYALMTNHIHMILESSAQPISVLMHNLLTSYSVYFNQRHQKTGHLFQDRFYSVVIEREFHLTNAVRYIHRNSTKAGIVRRPEDDPWSSHRDYIGMRRSDWVDSAPVLEKFGADPRSARDAFIEFSGMPPTEAETEAPLDGFPKGLKAPGPKEIEDVIEDTQNGLLSMWVGNENSFNSTLVEIRSGSRRGPVSASRRQFSKMAVAAGFRPSEIGRFLGCSVEAILMIISRGEVR